MEFRLAERRDEPALRGLVERAAMPGSVRVSFRRSPDFFGGVSMQGRTVQTAVAVTQGRIVGMGCRAVKDVYVNGYPTDVGYLGGLRIASGSRGGMMLGRAYRFLKTLHAEDGRARVYLTTIVAENRAAIEVLTSRRAGLPVYTDFGAYETYALHVRRRPRDTPPRGITVTGDGEMPLDAIVAFVNDEGRRRQFFPVLHERDIGSPYFAGLRRQDFLVAIRGDKIAGVLGIWDQHAYKQTRVEGYSRGLGMLRPAINAVYRVMGHPSLPSPGSDLRLRSVALPVVRDDDSDVLVALLRAALDRLARSPCEYLCFGVHERDPLRAGVRRFPHTRYRSRLFVVAWEDGEDALASIDSDRVPYLELGSL